MSDAPDRTTVHALASEILGPVLATSGFGRSARGSWMGTSRTVPERVQLQLSKWNGAGRTSEFTVNISAGPGAAPDQYGNRPSRRLSTTLEAHDLESMRELRNRVTTKALRIPMDHGDGTRLDLEPYRLYHDVWMNYTDEEDVRTWMVFLVELLPMAIERTRTDWWPPLPE